MVLLVATSFGNPKRVSQSFNLFVVAPTNLFNSTNQHWARQL